MNRLIGIETEYGITLNTEQECDPVRESIELIKSYRHEDFRPMWDYKGEDPFRDERGFRANTLHEHPDEANYQEMDQQHPESFVEIKSDLILTNGARLYNDHAHPEYSTAECQNLFDLIAHDKAGERILQQCAVRRSQKLNKDVILYKNNTDYKGHSYGCHDNYLMRRDIPFDYLKESLIPFLVTRQIFAGAGKLGIESEEEGMVSPGSYQISQRADFFQVEASVDTMHKRPIFNTRDEPHADPQKYRRLHGIAGDANMSEYSTALKIGSTALVIDLIESRLIPDNFAVIEPIRAIKEISRDQTYRWQLNLKNGKTTTAIDLQRQYLELAQQHLDPNNGETDWILAEWGAILNQLEQEPMELVDRIDWVTKKWLLTTFVEEEGIEWDDPWLQSLALQYHDIDPESGLYYALETQGSMRRVVTDGQINHAIHNPPKDTRAYFRGKSIDKFTNQIESVQWDHVTFSLNGKAISVNMNKLTDPEIAEKYNRVLDQAQTVEELIDNLGIG
ncbi:TPA: proteasome accessory factor PafA2 [Candidatus Poribacteria bacterium]|nr:proteasome accessory factor PafA2 [Candidatus Poribacteria bacterium]HIA68999.1 proteasome accessory factor PafA2 [Candidatus Poribacteria bacterium]HIB86090.1 proteasome accessory factor PafA2 [Candidatus Poribacteria bacterium]HIC00647.1 proteasome accessory factor PafA2 [Candidatus Poribacteria bacterium]HIN31751.1 proteasome accessory factor PafA2 [Candidatus Poribacteria bacterium]